MKLRVNVTKNDIRNGKPQEVRACPIALSLKRHKGIINPLVGGITVAYTRPGRFGELSADLPERARNFVRRFDERLKVRPFKFVLEAK